LNLQFSDYKAGVLTSRPPSLDRVKLRVRNSNGVTRNYDNYRYGKYVGNALRRKVNYSKDITTENALLAALSI